MRQEPASKMSQSAGKPNSVRLRACPPCGRPTRRRNDHSSRPGIARGLQRPTRWSLPCCQGMGRAVLYATLFGLAPCGVLPATDVTAGAVRSYRTFSPLPFDAALSCHAQGGIFSVPLIRQVALPGRYPAPCPVEFGLSSPPDTSRWSAVAGSSGRLAGCDGMIIARRAIVSGAGQFTVLL